MKKRTVGIGLILTVITLIIHILIMNDYGITWDFHHHFFAGMHLLKQEITTDLSDNLPFTEPDPRGTYKLPFGPLMSISPVATYLLFYKQLHLLAFDNAYNISIIIWGVIGIFILYLFLAEAVNIQAAVFGFLFLALLPRHFGDLHNNMKDIPQATTFTLAIWLFWRLMQYRRIRDLIVASCAFAIAFNTKVNTLAVPMIAFFWSILVLVSKLRTSLKIPVKPSILALRSWLGKTYIVWLYFLLAPLFSFALWSLFWDDPIGQLLYIPSFFRDNTQNIEVLFFGKWYCSAVNVPWYYPIGYVGITTPLTTLFFALIGLIISLWTIHRNTLSSLILLWFLVPISRYLLPSMGVIDGIRHFMEVVFPLTFLAGQGSAYFYVSIKKLFRRIKGEKIYTLGLIGIFSAIISYLLFTIILFHPFQIAYYNEIVGGILGAYGKFDLDYWGSSQKKAMQWLNMNAPQNAFIHVVMAGDAAAKYLRPDLRANVNKKGFDQSDYMVVLNRQSFFYRYFWSWEHFLRKQTAYIVSNQGVPIVLIYDNHLPGTPRQKQWWQGESPCIRKYWESEK